MKKLFTLLFFAGIMQLGFGQLDVQVHEDGEQLMVQFPAGQNFEYKVSMVDPVMNSLVEMQSSKVVGNGAPTVIKWHVAAGMHYELAYRMPTATGEFSEWYKIDPMVLLSSEKH